MVQAFLQTHTAIAALLAQHSYTLHVVAQVPNLEQQRPLLHSEWILIPRLSKKYNTPMRKYNTRMRSCAMANR